MDHTDKMARDLLAQHERGDRFRSFAEGSVATLDDAYGVQRRFVSLLENSRGSPVGYKIGLTSARMQAMCGIDQPISGTILSETVHPSGASLPLSRYGRLGLEFEIAVRLGRDLPGEAGPDGFERAASAVNGVAAAIELIDDRGADYATLDVRSLVADNSWNAGIVLSDFRTEWPDLAGVRGTVRRDGVEVDHGHGSDVLGHPFAALTWLANHLAASGGMLRAGDVVLTGSLVQTRFPTTAEQYLFELGTIGAVELAVVA
jgi:2-keto-4-pentenoate hydratase